MSSDPAAAAVPAARGGARRRLAVTLPAVLLLAGGAALLTVALSGAGGGPHAQPLPTRLFNVAPAAALSLPAPAALARPQPGSIQHECEPLPAARPQADIPSLCIYAPLVPARVAGGVLRVPADVHYAGLDVASAPLRSAYGTAIIAGHVDDYRQGDGAFYFLYQVRPGALVTVTGLNHQVTRWRVYRTAVTGKTSLPPGIWSLSGPHRLVLVTCGGPLLHTPAGSTYRDNVLIYATPATTRPAKPGTGTHHHRPHRRAVSGPHAGPRTKGAPQLVT